MLGPACMDIYVLTIEHFVSRLNSCTCTRCREVNLGVKNKPSRQKSSFDGKSNVLFAVTHMYSKYDSVCMGCDTILLGGWLVRCVWKLHDDLIFKGLTVQ